MHAGLRSFAILPGIDPDARALIQRGAGDPGKAILGLYSDSFRLLKRSGIFDSLDLFFPFAGPAAAIADTGFNARRNWISDRFNLVVTGSPVFTAGQGYTGDVASSAVLVASGYSESAGGTKAILNAATYGIYTRTAASYDGSTSHLDLYTGTARLGRRSNVSANYNIRVDDGTSGSIAVAAQTGHFAIRRTSSTERSLWRNGAQVSTDATASTGVGTTFSVFGTASNFSDAQLSLAYAGAALSDTQMATLDSIVTTLLTGLGAI